MARTIDSLWGAAQYWPGTPKASVVQQAVYIPFDPNEYISDDQRWGVFASDGSSIAAAEYRRGEAGERVSGGASFEETEFDCADPEFSYVYLGPFMQHYGHFITATLARCWYPFLNISDRTRFVIHSEADIEAIFSYSYAATCFARLGINRKNLVRFTRPTCIAHLICPEPAFEEQHFYRGIFRHVCQSIGIPFNRGDRSYQPVYLSKQKLPAGVGKIVNEDELVAHLQGLGFLIVYPEMLPLSEQIALFNRHDYVVGSGSALHTSIFCSNVPRMVSLGVFEKVNSNFALIDRVSGGETKHILPESGSKWNHYPEHVPAFIDFMRKPDTQPVRSMGSDVSGFTSASEIFNPHRFAQEIHDLLRSWGYSG